MVTQISNKLDIPRPVIAVVSEILADNFTHSRINILFSSAGAPGDAPDGNKVDKCHNWLLRCNRKPGVNALAVLGVLLEALLEVEQQTPCWKDQTDRIYAILRRHNLEYQRGGRILFSERPLQQRIYMNGYGQTDMQPLKMKCGAAPRILNLTRTLPSLQLVHYSSQFAR